MTAIAEDTGDRKRLEEGIALLNSALFGFDRAYQPLKWAETQHHIGTALSALGRGELTSGNLRAAVAALTAGLDEWNQENSPIAWAKGQNSLGNALADLGERERSRVDFEAAARAFDSALQVRTRESLPVEWASSSNNAATVLLRLAQIDGDAEQFARGVEVLRELSGTVSRSVSPMIWATAQSNLGVALNLLGVKTGRQRCFEEALSVFNTASLEWSRDRSPKKCAGLQANLGQTNLLLGEFETGLNYFEDGLECYRRALQVYTRDAFPLFWITCQRTVANILVKMAEREMGQSPSAGSVTLIRRTDSFEIIERETLLGPDALQAMISSEKLRETGVQHLTEATSLFRDIERVFPPDGLRALWADVQADFTRALLRLGEQADDTTVLEEALEHANLAFQVLQDERFTDRWINTQILVGQIQERIGERQTGSDALQSSINTLRPLLAIIKREDRMLWSILRHNLGLSLKVLGYRQGDVALTKKALDFFGEARETYEEMGAKKHLEWIDANIRSARAVLETSEVEIG